MKRFCLPVGIKDRMDMEIENANRVRRILRAFFRIAMGLNNDLEFVLIYSWLSTRLSFTLALILSRVPLVRSWLSQWEKSFGLQPPKRSINISAIRSHPISSSFCRKAAESLLNSLHLVELVMVSSWSLYSSSSSFWISIHSLS